MVRDGFMPGTTRSGSAGTGSGFTSSFDVERVEIINGPQALLYGFSGAGGAVNIVSKQARLGKPTFGSLRFQVDEYGHKQGQLDLGASLKNVAVRLAATHQQLGLRR
jgi:outer membrane receptor protein involved in Fe transport